MLPAALPDSEGDPVDFALNEPDVKIGMTEVLGQCAAGALDGDEAGLDGDFNTVRDSELFGLENVPHLSSKQS